MIYHLASLFRERERESRIILNSIHSRDLPEDEENFTALSVNGFITLETTNPKEVFESSIPRLTEDQLNRNEY